MSWKDKAYWITPSAIMIGIIFMILYSAKVINWIYIPLISLILFSIALFTIAILYTIEKKIIITYDSSIFLSIFFNKKINETHLTYYSPNNYPLIYYLKTIGYYVGGTLCLLFAFIIFKFKFF